MKKKVLILVLSADFEPYKEMIDTSMRTWDMVEEESMETIFYCASWTKEDNGKVIYLKVGEDYYHMSRKTLMAFEWALENKEFDYIARPHSCIYVNKKSLRDYIDGLPNENVFSCLEVKDEEIWAWGGIGFILSKDVVKRMVLSRQLLDIKLMEDVGLSRLINMLGVPYTKGLGCSINKFDSGRWGCFSYGTESFEFDDFADIVKSKGQYFYRVKYDPDRNVDRYIMEQLHKYL